MTTANATERHSILRLPLQANQDGAFDWPAQFAGNACIVCAGFADLQGRLTLRAFNGQQSQDRDAANKKDEEHVFLHSLHPTDHYGPFGTEDDNRTNASSVDACIQFRKPRSGSLEVQRGGVSPDAKFIQSSTSGFNWTLVQFGGSERLASMNVMGRMTLSVDGAVKSNIDVYPLDVRNRVPDPSLSGISSCRLIVGATDPRPVQRPQTRRRKRRAIELFLEG